MPDQKQFSTVSSLLHALAISMNLINPDLENHHQQTAYLAYHLGTEMGIREKDLHLLIIASLLHDVCKTNIYKKAKKWRKNQEDRWEQYDTYEVDYGRFPVGHGEKSVIMLLRLGLELTNDEIVAIRWHMSAWDLPFQSYEMKTSISTASDEYPLTAIIQCADGLATHIIEG